MLFERKELEAQIEKDPSGYYFATYKGLRLNSVFQPIFTNDEHIFGYEALLRITRDDGSHLRADHFFKSSCFTFYNKLFVERLSRAIHIRNFAQSSARDSRLFLNTLPKANEYFLNNSQNTKLLMQRLEELGLNPNQIVIEIVELDSYNESRLKDAIDHLKDLGFTIAIDDYGVDCSDKDRVNLIQPNIVKLDKSLLEEYSIGNRQGLCEALDLSASIHAKTVIEGIETEAQFHSIKELDIGMYQGFHLASPVQLDVNRMI